jgi:hypothetical protein
MNSPENLDTTQRSGGRRPSSCSRLSDSQIKRFSQVERWLKCAYMTARPQVGKTRAAIIKAMMELDDLKADLVNSANDQIHPR